MGRSAEVRQLHAREGMLDGLRFGCFVPDGGGEATISALVTTSRTERGKGAVDAVALPALEGHPGQLGAATLAGPPNTARSAREGTRPMIAANRVRLGPRRFMPDERHPPCRHAISSLNALEARHLAVTHG